MGLQQNFTTAASAAYDWTKNVLALTGLFWAGTCSYHLASAPEHEAVRLAVNENLKPVSKRLPRETTVHVNVPPYVPVEVAKAKPLVVKNLTLPVMPTVPDLKPPIERVVAWGDSNANGLGKSLLGRVDVTNLGKDSAGLDATTKVLPSSAFLQAAKPGRVGFIWAITNDIEPMMRHSHGKVSDDHVKAYAKRLVDIALKATDKGMPTAVVGINQAKEDYYDIKGDYRVNEHNPAAKAVNKALRETIRELGNPLLTFVLPQGEQNSGGIHQKMSGYRDTAKQALIQLHQPELASRVGNEFKPG